MGGMVSHPKTQVHTSTFDGMPLTDLLKGIKADRKMRNLKA
jgi:hypothetical protein